MKGKALIFTLFLLFSFGRGYSQICELVNITSKPLITLPECTKSNGQINFFGRTSGGTPPYVYTLNDTSNRIGLFSDLPLGEYTFLVEDARLCSSYVTVTLQYREIEKIIRPDNAFTPNGDNLNDTWRIPGLEGFAGSEVRVFNRWGQQVYVNSNYSTLTSWDGKQGNSKLPAGTYYYVISIINNCVEQYLKGAVTIVR